MNRFFLLVAFALSLASCEGKKGNSHIDHLKAMFEDVAIKKRADLIPQYYHQDFLLYTNNQVTDRKSFLESHTKTCASPIQFEIVYDEETFLEQGDKVAGRVFITTTMPNEAPHKIEVILVATYKEGKISKLWELTYPDWSKLPEFLEKK